MLRYIARISLLVALCSTASLVDATTAMAPAAEVAPIAATTTRTAVGQGGETASAAAPGSTYNWLSVAAGSFATCAIRVDHSLWCWGDGRHGALGNGRQVVSLVPVQVGTERDWVSVSAGYGQACGIRERRGLYCWGDGRQGELGDGQRDIRLVPTRVGTARWLRVVTSDVHTCAIRLDHTLYCWGQNYAGELGIGMRFRTFPTPQRVGTATNWNSLGLGFQHTCGIRLDHTLWCWGDPSEGALGIPQRYVFVPHRVGSSTNWASIRATGESTCGIRLDSSLWCWGSNVNWVLGLLGDQSRRVPTRVGGLANWLSIDMGFGAACGVRRDHSLWCWGTNSYGSLGNGTEVGTHVPQRTGDSSGWWLQVTVGDFTPCVTRSGQNLLCWGYNNDGEVGDGTRIDRYVPTPVG